MKASLDAGLPAIAGSSFDPSSLREAGIVDGHAHTVLRVFERGGQRYVELREPYGRYEPRGDGVKDGVFTLPLDQFAERFDVVFRILA